MNKFKLPLILRTLFSCVYIIAIAALFSGCAPKIPDEGLVEGSPWLLGTTQFQLEDVGYEQSEYFIRGKAHSYASVVPLTIDGKWKVDPVDEADFKTRIVVYRPIDPARFNGTVLIEWLNVSGGTEASSEWIMAHTELIRSGYAWVGVSAQKAGIDGGGITVLPISLALKTLNPFRYDTLEHPGDKFAYDIFHQAAKSVLQPQNFSPLGDLKVERVIAAGESQSADFL
ncbi:MAG TPA: alpha/beta hydrolase domain-containing protein, partial [Dongiaceae bacterium]|nr:alpha/beta hydrolase domain-containing protein [Dongiaceae bacterium]